MTDSKALDHAWIRSELDARHGVVGLPLRYEAQVGSTSDVALDLARAGASHGTTVVADEQTAGRGRRGASQWQTPPRVSVALSTVLRLPGIEPSYLGRLGLCIAVAVAEAIEGATGARVLVKWPNDLVVVGPDADVSSTRKVGGVLVEPAVLAAVPARVGHVVVGIGVNANSPSSSLAPIDANALPPISLVDVVEGPVSREKLIVEILGAISVALNGWSDPEWPSWQARYEARMAWRGSWVVADGDAPGANRLHGRVLGIDTSGAIVIAGDNGIATLVATGRVRAACSGESPPLPLPL